MARPDNNGSAAYIAGASLKAASAFAQAVRELCMNSDIDTVMAAMDVLSLSRDGSDFERGEAIAALTVFVVEAALDGTDDA